MKIYKAIIYIVIVLVVLIGLIWYWNKQRVPPVQVVESPGQALEVKHAGQNLSGSYSIKAQKVFPLGKIRMSYNAIYRNIEIDLSKKKPDGTIPITGDIKIILNNFSYLDSGSVANVQDKEKIFKLQGTLWTNEKMIDLAIAPQEQKQPVVAKMPDGTSQSFTISDFYFPLIGYKEGYNIQETDAFLLEAPPEDVVPENVSNLEGFGELYFIKNDK